MANQRLTLLRIQKQEKLLNKEPVPNMLVKRKGALNFHFCIYGLQGQYADGFYHGVLELAQDYPFSPPQLKFFTESGRFDTNKAICTSFTNFHKQQWSSAWNIRTMLLGVVSFMNSPEGGNGSINSSYSARRNYALKSLKLNLQSEEFRELFYDKILELKLMNVREDSHTIEAASHIEGNKVPADNRVYILMMVLVVVLFFYAMIKRGNGTKAVEGDF